MKKLGNKAGGDMMNYLGIGAVFLIVLVIYGFMSGTISFPQLGDIGGDGGGDVEGADEPLNCPDDGVTTLNVKVFDDWSATPNTPLASTITYAKNLDSGVIEANATSSASAWATMDVECGNTYEVYAVTYADTTGSAKSVQFVANENNEYIRLHTNSLSKMTVKLKDIDGDDWEYGFADALTSTTNSTTGVDLNATNFYDDNAATAFAVGSDGNLNLEIYLQSATAREFGNDKGMLGVDSTSLGLNHYACVDLGGATNGQEWDTDSLKVTVDGGSSLPNVKGQIDTDSKDYVYLQQSEACFEIGDIDDTYTTIGFYVKAKDSNDPDSTDDSITVYFLSEGLYKSSDDLDEIKTGIFTDASTQLPVTYSSEVPYLVLKVS